MGGKLIIVSAPSGAGKTTIVKKLLDAGLGLEFSVSACSRPKRPNETDGRDYYFLTVPEFRQKIKDKAFMEWEEVYKNLYYGTLNSEVERIWKKGKHVIFDVDVKGGLNIKQQYPDDSLAIFIQAPSLPVLQERLLKRSTEDPESLLKRLDKAGYEMNFAGEFDKIIVNEDLAVAADEAIRTVGQFLKQKI